jgi:hypothetical protein
MRSWQALVAGIGTVSLLAACGGGGFAEESPDAIAEAAGEDMRALSAVRMAGDLRTDEQEMTIDLTLNTDGDCEGTLQVQGGEAQILSVGGESWMKLDDAMWDVFAG